MSNYRLQTTPAGAGLPIRIESKDTTIDFQGVRFGADNLALTQEGSGVTARLDTNGNRLKVGTATDAADATSLAQVQGLVSSGLNTSYWQKQALSELADPPGSPATGARYLVIAPATAAFSSQENNIAEWNGSTWVFYTPLSGWILRVATQSNRLRIFTGSVWGSLYFNTAYIEKRFSVGVGGQAAFVCSPQIDILSGSRVDVYRNGLLQVPGPSADYELNDATDTVTFTYTLPQYAEVYVRQFLE